MATFIDLKNKIKTLKSSLYTLAINKGASFDGDVESLTFTKILQGMETIQVGGTGGNYSDSEVLSLEEAIAQMGGTVNKVGDIATAEEIIASLKTIKNGGNSTNYEETVSVGAINFKRINVNENYEKMQSTRTNFEDIATNKLTKGETA